ncbi:MAG: glycerol-3-phosphate 1-O-acyltransferase PlsY [Deltaproteobacteria bacterium]|nr:glycerol-3-phosphate 1-O-acyltransferase PlsY [Deltaproteobacteria bacterium]
MTTYTLYHLFIPAAYLIGSIPFGIIVARAFGKVDPRGAGSKNIGATNVGRTAGRAAGILTLILDAGKGVAPMLALSLLFPEPRLMTFTGLAAITGHLFPVFLGFKGGKGVATACGVMFIVSPIATALGLAVFIVIVFAKRYVSLGSIIASASLPVFLSVLPGARVYVPMGVAVSILIIVKHRENIKRLAAGTENKIGKKG